MKEEEKLYSEYSNSPIEFMKKNNLGTTKEVTLFLMKEFAESSNQRGVSDSDNLTDDIMQVINTYVDNYNHDLLDRKIYRLLESKLSNTVQETSDNWVRVEERYPDSKNFGLIKCIICSEKGDIYEAMFNNKTKNFQYKDFTEITVFITHWQPLPSKPKDK